MKCNPSIWKAKKLKTTYMKCSVWTIPSNSIQSSSSQKEASFLRKLTRSKCWRRHFSRLSPFCFSQFNCLLLQSFELTFFRLLRRRRHGLSGLPRVLVGPARRRHVPDFLLVPQRNPLPATDLQLRLVVSETSPIYHYENAFGGGRKYPAHT